MQEIAGFEGVCGRLLDIGVKKSLEALRKSESLTFTVRAVKDYDALSRAVKVRQSAYARHLPQFAEKLGQPEEADFDESSVVLLAESKLDGSALGTMRIHHQLGRAARIGALLAPARAIRREKARGGEPFGRDGRRGGPSVQDRLVQRFLPVLQSQRSVGDGDHRALPAGPPFTIGCFSPMYARTRDLCRCSMFPIFRTASNRWRSTRSNPCGPIASIPCTT